MPRILLLLLILISSCAHSAQPTPEVKTPLQLLTFNIRYGTANDGAHAWPARRELVADMIRTVNPDVLAIQEALDFQLDELADVLKEYTKVGVHRGGGSKGEFSGLYVHPRQLSIHESGTFWLSTTPDVVASKDWDAAITRTATWAELQWQGQTLRIYGTHFDHVGKQARLESARLIRKHAQGRQPVIVMGDLNAEESSAPLLEFFDNGYTSVVRQLMPDSVVGTFNGFKDPTGGRRIDHVLIFDPGATPLLETRSAQIHVQRVNGIFPSDHFPVSASFVLNQ
ncbi:MAG: endonuclease/exonuclease/phosphatase family protein [Planctomycetes bacterium]|nr:endonuclease/exonuclease/phosphatase family protein [Planctomycetota bacterium]